MYSDILSLVRTSHDRDILNSELDSLRNAIFEPKNGGVDKALASEVRVSVAGLIRNHLATEPADAFVDGLKKALAALEDVNITLAFEPTEEVVDIIYNWVSAKLGHGVILVFDTNPLILGGARIAYKGKYYDGGFAQVVERTLSQDMNEVIKMIHTASK